MSGVNFLKCTICDPSAGDINGIRRPVHVTSQEVTELVQHMISAHSGINEATEEAARATLSADHAALLANQAMSAIETKDNLVPPSTPDEEETIG